MASQRRPSRDYLLRASPTSSNLTSNNFTTHLPGPSGNAANATTLNTMSSNANSSTTSHSEPSSPSGKTMYLYAYIYTYKYIQINIVIFQLIQQFLSNLTKNLIFRNMHAPSTLTTPSSSEQFHNFNKNITPIRSFIFHLNHSLFLSFYRAHPVTSWNQNLLLKTRFSTI